MAIRKRDDSWQIDYFDPDGKRKRQSFKTRKEATLELAARINAIDSGTYRDKSIKCKTTLSQMIEVRYKEKFGQQKSFRAKRGALRQFSEWVQERKGHDPLLSNIDYEDLDGYKNHLDRQPTYKGTPHTKRAINVKITNIHQLFSYAVKLKLIRESPFNGDTLKYEEQRDTHPRYLEKDEIKKLLDECAHDRDLFRRVVWGLNSGMDHGLSLIHI